MSSADSILAAIQELEQQTSVREEREAAAEKLQAGLLATLTRTQLQKQAEVRASLVAKQRHAGLELELLDTTAQIAETRASTEVMRRRIMRQRSTVARQEAELASTSQCASVVEASLASSREANVEHASTPARQQAVSNEELRVARERMDKLKQSFFSTFSRARLQKVIKETQRFKARIKQHQDTQLDLLEKLANARRKKMRLEEEARNRRDE